MATPGDASSRGKNNRRRGQGGERELCALLSDALGTKVMRNLGQERDSGTDVTLPPFRIECKRRKRIGNLYAWLQQAHGGSAEHSAAQTPALALRQDGGRWLMVMYLDDWITLAREEISK